MTVILSFQGWCLIRLATDPDPSDEPRGVSGYTFAFPGEPPLDRIVRFQRPDDPRLVRSHSPDIGVTVTGAVRTDTNESIEGLNDASVNLDGEPKLENRNWTLTLPGREPIVPFNLRITKEPLKISRDAPLDPKTPDQPIWRASAAALAAHGADGINPEPKTVRDATGIRSSIAEVKKRLKLLCADLETKTKTETETVAALHGRIAELKYALANPTDRRVTVRQFVERFSFPMVGPRGQVDDPEVLLGGQLDQLAPWNVSFWIGGWDPDLLCAYVKGELKIPLLAAAGQGPAMSAGRPEASRSARLTAASSASERPRT